MISMNLLANSKKASPSLTAWARRFGKKQTALKHLETFQRLKPISDKSKRGIGFIRKQYAEKHQQELNEFAKAVRYMNANGINAADHERIAGELQQLHEFQQETEYKPKKQQKDALAYDIP